MGRYLTKPSITVSSLFCVWVNWKAGLTDGGSQFRMRIILGMILIWFLVFHACVPDCSRNGSGVRPYLWVQKNSSNLDRAPKMRDYVLLNSWDSFLVTLLWIASRICVIYSLLILGTDVFRDSPFLGCFSCVSLVTAAKFRLFLNVAIFLKGRMVRSYEDWISFYL